MSRVGQNRMYTPYMTVYMVNSLPKIPYTHRICMVMANPTYECLFWCKPGPFDVATFQFFLVQQDYHSRTRTRAPL